MKNSSSIQVFASIAELLAVREITVPPLFDDFHLTPLYAFGAGTIPPYCSDFYQIALLRDLGEKADSPYTVQIVAPGTVSSGMRNPATMGFLFYFTESFVPLPPGELAQTFPFVHAPVLALDKALFDDLLAISEAMLLETRNTLGGALRPVLQAYLLILLYRCQAACNRRENRDVKQPRAHTLIDRFRQLINTHYLTHRAVADYARLLNLTPGHLNDSVKDTIGQNASALINARLLTEAKNLLTFSSMDMAQIAHHLRFSDPSHFGKFFKRATGVTPLEFRRQHQSVK